jgi:hypothetical protein
MTGSAKQSSAAEEELDCFVASLLAMTLRHNYSFSRQPLPEKNFDFWCKFDFGVWDNAIA